MKRRFGTHGKTSLFYNMQSGRSSMERDAE